MTARRLIAATFASLLTAGAVAAGTSGIPTADTAWDITGTGAQAIDTAWDIPK